MRPRWARNSRGLYTLRDRRNFWTWDELLDDSQEPSACLSYEINLSNFRLREKIKHGIIPVMEDFGKRMRILAAALHIAT